MYQNIEALAETLRASVENLILFFNHDFLKLVFFSTARMIEQKLIEQVTLPLGIEVYNNEIHYLFFSLYFFLSKVRNIPERIIQISTTGLRSRDNKTNI